MQKNAMILGWLLGVVPWSGVHADSEHDAATESVKHLGDFQVIELRRYNVKSGERQHFVEYFEAYFPEALEQLGSIVFGQFYDRSAESHFTWLRGFKDINARPIVSAAFYYGPVWREHRVVVNALFPDAPDNVLLLRPLTPEHAITVLPAGAIFAAYGESGIREAGELVTLDVANNFPQLPIREDGPFFVWLGIARDEKMVQRFKALARSVEPTLSETGMLRIRRRGRVCAGWTPNDGSALTAGSRRLDGSTVRTALHHAVLALRHVAKRVKKIQAHDYEQQHDGEAQ